MCKPGLEPFRINHVDDKRAPREEAIARSRGQVFIVSNFLVVLFILCHRHLLRPLQFWYHLQAMSCVNNVCRRIRNPAGSVSTVPINKGQIRGKNDVFPLPPSFKLSKAARAGRPPSKAHLNSARSSIKPNIKPLRSRARELTSALPLRLNATNFANATTDAEAGSKATLDNAVEDFVNHKIAYSAGLDSGRIIQQQFGTQHPDLHEFMPAFIKRGEFSSESLRLFWNAFNGLLPPDPYQPSTIETPKGKLYRRSYMTTAPLDRPGMNRAPLHGHLTMFNHPIDPSQLLSDGTDKRFLPGPGDVWKHRLWAGGSINLFSYHPRSYDSSELYHMVERPVDIRVVGKDQQPQRVFVTVRKSFYLIENMLPASLYNRDRILEVLNQRPTYNGDLRKPKEDRSLGILTRGPGLEEEYTLCFLREPPNFNDSSTKVVKPPPKPKFTHTLTPNRHLLFCWSALTYNAHLIHLDPTFAKQEYGAPDLLVHGPLTLYLVLEWFNRQLQTYAKDRQLSTFHLKSINYRNLLPLYVDEPMKLCMKPSEFPKPGELAPVWDVWIEKTTKEGTPTMAFRGEITVSADKGPLVLGPEGQRISGSEAPESSTVKSTVSAAAVRQERQQERQRRRLAIRPSKADQGSTAQTAPDEPAAGSSQELEIGTSESNPRKPERKPPLRPRTQEAKPKPKSEPEEEEIKFESPFFP
ncbi:hypothetical protein PMZ80_009394 [Knufia obscura]|uniref:Uncharacterized protein n=1 Tax=Knufia obscura TaxID=1635080 RepID=A0ABR0RE88_9EURO|nr:hypothetical protein PMZ80_009394 [Knufia obscura]